MNDETNLAPAPAPAIARLADCKRTEVDDLVICNRCGMQWDLEDPAPPACDPMSYSRMRARLVAEISSADTSLEIVAKLKRAGTPADPSIAKRKLAELEALLRFFDIHKPQDKK